MENDQTINFIEKQINKLAVVFNFMCKDAQTQRGLTKITGKNPFLDFSFLFSPASPEVPDPGSRGFRGFFVMGFNT